jgi:hypothetical protein
MAQDGIETEVIESPFDVQELGAIDKILSFRERASRWIEGKNGDSLTVYLYRLVGATDKKITLNRYDSLDVPDEHDIGLTYGAGKYMIVVNLPKTDSDRPKSNSWVFTCAEHYNDLLKQNKRMFENSPQIIQQQPVVSPIESLKPILEMVATFFPLIKSMIPQNNSTAMMAEFQKTIMQMQSDNALHVNKLMLDNARENMKAITEVIKNQSESCETLEDIPDTGIDFVDKIKDFMPLIMQFLPALSGSGPASFATAQAVKSIPEVKKLINNKSAVALLIEQMKKQPNVTNEQISNSLKALGIKAAQKNPPITKKTT